MMMIPQRGKWICLTLVMTALLGCSKPESDAVRFPVAERIEAGTPAGRTYSNESFNFRITIPEEWHVADPQEKKRLWGAGADSLWGHDAKMKTASLRTEEDGAFHFLAFRHHPNAKQNFGLSIGAERVPLDSGLVTGADYLDHTREVLLRSQTEPRFRMIEHGQRVGSLTMDAMTYQLSDAVEQRLHATRVGEFMLLITIAYATEQERSQLLEILQTVEPLR